MFASLLCLDLTLQYSPGMDRVRKPLVACLLGGGARFILSRASLGPHPLLVCTVIVCPRKKHAHNPCCAVKGRASSLGVNRAPNTLGVRIFARSSSSSSHGGEGLRRRQRRFQERCCRHPSLRRSSVGAPECLRRNRGPRSRCHRGEHREGVEGRGGGDGNGGRRAQGKGRLAVFAAAFCQQADDDLSFYGGWRLEGDSGGGDSG